MPRPPSRPEETTQPPGAPRRTGVREKIVDVLRPKTLSERLGKQAEDHIHGRQAYWESEGVDGRKSLIYTPRLGSRATADTEAQKAHEVEPDFVQTARDIGEFLERIRSIPKKVEDPAILEKLQTFSNEVDPSVFLTMREAIRSLEDAMRPLVAVLEDAQRGIAELVRSSDAPVYDSSALKPVIDEMREATPFDEELSGESTDYAATKPLEDSHQVWNQYRELLKEDPSRRTIYYVYLLDLLHQLIAKIDQMQNLQWLDTLFNQLSKNLLHWMSDAIALPYGTELDERVKSSKYVRESEITEAERALFVLKVVKDVLRVAEISRSFNQIIGSVELERPLVP